MLEVKDLNVSIDKKIILKQINLKIGDHEIVSLVGPNGCGKTTILKAIFNHFTIKKTGQVIFNGKDITNSLPQEIAKCGIHMMQQNPETIVGLKTMDLLQALLKNQDKTKQMSDFYVKVLKRLSDLGLTNDILEREVNFNWSGGEKKKFQVLLMELCAPKLILVDEIDTGLDVDALKKVCELIKEYYDNHPDTSIIVISHSNFIYHYLTPTHAYLILNKHVVREGNYELVKDIADHGYAKYRKEVGNEGVSDDEFNNQNYQDELKQ